MKWGRAETNRRKRLTPRLTSRKGVLTTSDANARLSPQPTLLHAGSPPRHESRPVTLAG